MNPVTYFSTREEKTAALVQVNRDLQKYLQDTVLLLIDSRPSCFWMSPGNLILPWPLETCSSWWNSHRLFCTSKPGEVWPNRMLVEGRKAAAKGVWNTWGPLQPCQTCPTLWVSSDGQVASAHSSGDLSRSTENRGLYCHSLISCHSAGWYRWNLSYKVLP